MGGRKVSLHLHPSLTKVISGKGNLLPGGSAQRPLEEAAKTPCQGGQVTQPWCRVPLTDPGPSPGHSMPSLPGSPGSTQCPSSRSIS